MRFSMGAFMKWFKAFMGWERRPHNIYVNMSTSFCLWHAFFKSRVFFWREMLAQNLSLCKHFKYVGHCCSVSGHCDPHAYFWHVHHIHNPFAYIAWHDALIQNWYKTMFGKLKIFRTVIEFWCRTWKCLECLDVCLVNQR